MRLFRIADDPAIITRFQNELTASGLPAASRVQVLKILRSVLRWGRRRYPRTLTVEFSGRFELPSQQRKRLIYAADPVAVERLIEAVLARPARNALLPIRDAALVAAMGFTVAARPSEWLHSTTWADLYDDTVEFQRPDARLTDSLEPSDDELEEGLKTGARAALLFASARDRVRAYRTELEARCGAQPDHGLVFQALGPHGPLWQKDGTPVAWSADDYKRWTARRLLKKSPQPLGHATRLVSRRPKCLGGHVEGLKSLQIERGFGGPLPRGGFFRTLLRDCERVSCR